VNTSDPADTTSAALEIRSTTPVNIKLTNQIKTLTITWISVFTLKRENTAYYLWI
jgi:hypothetical protein